MKAITKYDIPKGADETIGDYLYNYLCMEEIAPIHNLISDLENKVDYIEFEEEPEYKIFHKFEVCGGVVERVDITRLNIYDYLQLAFKIITHWHEAHELIDNELVHDLMNELIREMNESED